jgi:non-heme chloroperoxidase
LSEQVAGAQTVFFENSGHMPFYEEPETFNQVVRDFDLSL